MKKISEDLKELALKIGVENTDIFQEELQEYIRNNYGLHICIDLSYTKVLKPDRWYYIIEDIQSGEDYIKKMIYSFYLYEDCLEDALKQTINYILNGKH